MSPFILSLKATEKKLDKYQKHLLKSIKDITGGPVVKNPPSNAGDAGSVPGRGTKIPHAVGELRSHMPWGN